VTPAADQVYPTLGTFQSQQESAGELIIHVITTQAAEISRLDAFASIRDEVIGASRIQDAPVVGKVDPHRFW
jgi:hypothetical protein